MLACRAHPGLHEVSDRAGGSAIAEMTLLGVAGPALATVSVQVPVPPTVRLAGHRASASGRWLGRG